MTADVSVRLAWPDDAPAIARLQAEAWRETYGGLVPEETLRALPEDAFAARWNEALRAPQDARQRVLVALEGPRVRGMAVTQPSADPDADPVADAEIGEFAVAPQARGAGHGSRLVQACLDTVRADGFTRATWWVPAGADALRSWLAAAGWRPDGAHRELEADSGARLKQVRLHVAVAEDR